MVMLKDITGWRVLVVDDEPDNLNLVAELLEFSGAIVAKSRNGQGCLELVDEFKPNLILLDLAMPEMDGWEVHQRLRARSTLNAVPIVALTALVMPTDAQRVQQEGFDAYITKPFRAKFLLEELDICVRTFLSRSPNGGTKDTPEEAKHE
jgi:two-component system sensor histidine kinase EvgS